MSNDKHQALRDAAGRSIIVTVGSSSLLSLIADHDRMLEALQAISWKCDCCDPHSIAQQALQECEQ